MGRNRPVFKLPCLPNMDAGAGSAIANPRQAHISQAARRRISGLRQRMARFEPDHYPVPSFSSGIATMQPVFLLGQGAKPSRHHSLSGSHKACRHDFKHETAAMTPRRQTRRCYLIATRSILQLPAIGERDRAREITLEV
jgi:hypothetical protein